MILFLCMNWSLLHLEFRYSIASYIHNSHIIGIIQDLLFLKNEWKQFFIFDETKQLFWFWCLYNSTELHSEESRNGDRWHCPTYFLKSMINSLKNCQTRFKTIMPMVYGVSRQNYSFRLWSSTLSFSFTNKAKTISPWSVNSEEDMLSTALAW